MSSITPQEGEQLWTKKLLTRWTSSMKSDPKERLTFGGFMTTAGWRELLNYHMRGNGFNRSFACRMLLPYIISTRSAWANCKIRVFALTNRRQELEVEERKWDRLKLFISQFWFQINFSMANLLSKLRIDYMSLTMLQGVTDRPKEETIKLHNKVLDGFMEGQNNECFVSNVEYKQLQDKTYRQLRLREMLEQHSRDASLIVMSLPMPRQVISNFQCPEQFQLPIKF